MHIPPSATTYTHSPESKLREWSSLIGIITAIVGNILISFALNIQRYAHIRLSRQRERAQKSNGHGTEQSDIAEERAQVNLSAPADLDHAEDETTPLNLAFRRRSSSGSTIKQSEKPWPDAEKENYLKSPYWWAGILLMTVGEAGNFLAYGFAPASIVSPLGVVALVSNCVIAPFMLKERFRRRDLLGVIVAVGGAVTVVLSAKTSEEKMGPHDVWEAITRWEFELYLGITGVLMIALVWASARYGEKSIFIDLGLVALFGGYTALSTKGVASLLSYTLWHALTFPITYLLVAVLVATALLQIRYVNKALQRFNSTQVIPTQFVLFTISVIVGSAVLYRDFESATAGRVGKFIGGCALTFAGVYAITSDRGDEGVEDKVFDADEELAIDLVDEERNQANSERDGGEETQTIRPNPQITTSFRHGDEMVKFAHQESPLLSPTQVPLGKPYDSPTRAMSDAASSYRSARSTSHASSPPSHDSWLTSQESSEGRSGRQSLQSRISAPLLPSRTPDITYAATPHLQAHLAPSSTMAGRPSNQTRRSMSIIMPAPLASPLSSSLSAIVADSLRRGVDTSPTRRRSRLAELQRSKSHQADITSRKDHQGSSTLRPTPFRQNPQGSDASEELSRKGRLESFRATMNGFFRFHRAERASEESDVGRSHEGDEQRL